jgi:hypothetical protein
LALPLARPSSPYAPAAVAAVLAYGAIFAWAIGNTTFDVWGGLIVAPILVVISLPFLQAAARSEADPRIARLYVTALVLKLVASLGRYYMSFVLYDGAADAARYAAEGARIAGQIRVGDFTFDLGIPMQGTGFLVLITGIVYALTGPTLIGGYLVFSWLGFWGLFFFFRAFRVAIPHGNAWRYGCLVFLLPSLLFWPSGIGKDTWMLLTLGLASYGVALLLSRRRGAYVYLALGLAGTAMVRPHVSVLVVAGLGFGYVLRRRPDKLSALGPVRSIISVVVLLVAGVVMLRVMGTFLGTDGFSSDSVNQTLANTQNRTADGGSTFEAQPVTSPIGLPMAIITVLFRPFPYEAHNMQSLIASAEGTVLLGMFVVGWRQLRGIPRALRRSPYVAYCLVFTILFCFAFSSFSNFGILTRERVQVFPTALVLLALPVAAAHQRQERRKGRKGGKDGKDGKDGKAEKLPDTTASPGFARPQPVLMQRHGLPAGPAPAAERPPQGCHAGVLVGRHSGPPPDPVPHPPPKSPPSKSPPSKSPPSKSPPSKSPPSQLPPLGPRGPRAPLPSPRKSPGTEHSE